MKLLEKKDATESLAECSNQVEDGPIIVVNEGKPVAALISLSNADLETVSLSTNAEFMKLIEHSRRRQQTEGGISSAEMRSRLLSGNAKS